MGVWPSRVNINISVAPTTVCKPAQGKSGWELPEGRTRGDGWDGRFLPGSSPLSSGLQKETSAKGDAAPCARRLGKAIPGWGLLMLTPRSPDAPACHRSPTFPPAQGSPSLSRQPSNPGTPSLNASRPPFYRNYRETYSAARSLTHLLSCERLLAVVLAVVAGSVARAGCLGSL